MSKVESPRSQWSKLKVAARASGDNAAIAAIASAEAHAHAAMIDVYGRAALVHPTEAILDELCATALSLTPRHTARVEAAAQMAVAVVRGAHE
jgi:hypothetical protein